MFIDKFQLNNMERQFLLTNMSTSVRYILNKMGDEQHLTIEEYSTILAWGMPRLSAANYTTLKSWAFYYYIAVGEDDGVGVVSNQI
jgi:hypothetical protein